MRIAFFSWEYPQVSIGGPGTYALNMTRKFVELGHDVTVFSLNPGDLPTREVMKGVEVHRPIITNASRIFPLMSGDMEGRNENTRFFSDFFLYNVLSASKLVSRLTRKEGVEYDLVSYHDWLNSIACMMVKDELGIPTVFHAHSAEWERNGHESEMIMALGKEAVRGADGIITTSYAMKEDLGRQGWPEEKIHVMWNGIDTERYDPTICNREDIVHLRDEYGLREDDNLVLFVGHLNWCKGIRNLIRAMPDVLSKYPDTKLVILGRGKEQKGITELVSSLNIADRVYCRFEIVPEEVKILHYAAADLCVFPSVYEPFGTVSLEAMAMEKPVVVGARGVVGFREQVVPSGPDQNGIHVNGQDPSDIAWGIDEVLSNKRRAIEWGRKGRTRILKYFTWERAAEETIRCYQRIQARANSS